MEALKSLSVAIFSETYFLDKFQIYTDWLAINILRNPYEGILWLRKGNLGITSLNPHWYYWAMRLQDKALFNKHVEYPEFISFWSWFSQKIRLSTMPPSIIIDKLLTKHVFIAYSVDHSDYSEIEFFDISRGYHTTSLSISVTILLVFIIAVIQFTG